MKKAIVKTIFLSLFLLMGNSLIYGQDSPEPIFIQKNGIELKVWIPSETEEVELVKTVSYANKQEVLFSPKWDGLETWLDLLNGRLELKEKYFERLTDELTYSDFTSIEKSYLKDNWYIYIKNLGDLDEKDFFKRGYKLLTESLSISSTKIPVEQFKLYLTEETTPEIDKNIFTSKRIQKNCCQEGNSVVCKNSGIAILDYYISDKYQKDINTSFTYGKEIAIGESWHFKKLSIPLNVSFEELKVNLEKKYGLILEKTEVQHIGILYTSK